LQLNEEHGGLIVIQGEWRNDSQNGKGLWTFPSGQVYYGELRNGLYDGRGCIRFSNGKKCNQSVIVVIIITIITFNIIHFIVFQRICADQGYDGEWLEDKQHGHGKYYWPNGQFYDGEWRQSRFQGKGTFRYLYCK
jgi:hypothetical protein